MTAYTLLAARLSRTAGALCIGTLFFAADARADDPDEAPPATSTSAPVKPGPATAIVTNVYDGDTITLDTGDRVRLRWVNTPELKPLEDYGQEARDYTAALVQGKTVTLIYGSALRDGYGRLIAGVMIDDKNLSLELIKQGYGHLFVIPPDSTDLTGFVAAQDAARTARRGLWSTPRYQGALHITSFHANADGDDRENVNGEYLRICNVSPDPIELSGYQIADISGNRWTFPTLTVPAGHTFKLHSGKGTNAADWQAQLAVYLQNADPIWNNKLDRATIYDRYGRVQDARDHSVEKETP
ncbi:MAG: hypothetical protein EXR69_11590 [Myxococcales bacterium]|nr:hypothetical protein [Myxococcales bacterium]